MLLSIYQDVLFSRHMLPRYSPYVLGLFGFFLIFKFGGLESFAPLQAAYMRNIWKSRRGQKNLPDEYLRLLIFQFNSFSVKIQNQFLWCYRHSLLKPIDINIWIRVCHLRKNIVKVRSAQKAIPFLHKKTKYCTLFNMRHFLLGSGQGSLL